MGKDRHSDDKESLGGVRVPKERKKQAQEKAKREGKSLTDVVNEALEKYVEKDK